MNIKVPWAELKQFLDDRSVSPQYINFSSSYIIFGIDGDMILRCEMVKVNPAPVDSDQKDFEDNYKDSGNKTFTDSDGATINRPKAAKKGWTYDIVPIEFELSKLTSIYSKLVDETNRAGIDIKLYDSSDVEITIAANEPNAVKTVVTCELLYDFELIGGQLQQLSKPASAVRIWVIAVPDVPAPAGSKEMVGGVNLAYIDPTDKVDIDGRVAKYMTYDATYHTNKMQFTLKHDAGFNHDIMITMHLFKA